MQTSRTALSRPASSRPAIPELPGWWMAFATAVSVVAFLAGLLVAA
jgi:hypothetical protein